MGVGAIVWFVVGYLLGSIPFGLVVTRLAGTDDIRTVGSGNIGATNVLRTGRKSLAALTLIGDMLKGTVAVVLAHWWAGRDMALVAALAAVVGHVFPVWLRFKGGKGVATFIGVLIGIAWPVAVAFGVIWGAVAALTRFSSAAGLAATAATPVILWFVAGARAAIVFALLAALIFVMHRANITRLFSGTEPKIGQRRDAAA